MAFFFVLLSCTLHTYVDNGKGNQSFNSSHDGQVGNRQAVLGKGREGARGVTEAWEKRLRNQPGIPALQRQREVDFCEFKASLVYIVGSKLTRTTLGKPIFKKNKTRGWGFSSVVERLPRKRKALGSVPSSEKKNQKKKNK